MMYVYRMAVENNDSVSEIFRAAVSSLGYAEKRLLQETAVRAFVTGSDVFLSIPTGGGKSLLYAVLPRVFDMLRGNDKPRSTADFSSVETFRIPCLGCLVRNSYSNVLALTENGTRKVSTQLKSAVLVSFPVH